MLLDAASNAQQGLKDIINPLVHPFLALTAVGTLSMALIQTAKDVLPLRRWFQRKWIQDWLASRAEARPKKHEAPPQETGFAADPKAAEKDLVRMATSDDSDAFYELAIEQLCGQMNAAVQVSLDNAAGHKHLIWCLAWLADNEDLSAILEPPINEMRRVQAGDPNANRLVVDKYTAARNRVSHFIQRSIDGIQIAAGFEWKLRLQVLSIAVSCILSLVGLIFSGQVGTSLLWAIPMGILAGFVAPVSRDIIAAIQQFRK